MGFLCHTIQKLVHFGFILYYRITLLTVLVALVLVMVAFMVLVGVLMALVVKFETEKYYVGSSGAVGHKFSLCRSPPALINFQEKSAIK